MRTRHVEAISQAACFVACLASLTAAAAVALLVRLLQLDSSLQSERAVVMTGLMLIVIFAIAAGVAIFTLRRDAPSIALAVLAISSVLLSGVYLFSVSSAVVFRGDFLIWSESDFVNDILKWRTGYPLYTADVNNESFTYPFGTQLITYWIASAIGQPTSVPVFRGVQLLFTVLAAFVSALCCRRLVKRVMPDSRIGWLWLTVWSSILFLIATNPITNPFSHSLHNDALAQLITVVAMYLLLCYIETAKAWLLVVMACVPAVAFLCKQSLIMWAAFYCLFLLFCDRPFSFRRWLAFSAGSIALIVAVVGACLAIWGSPFYYWVFVVLGKHGVSPLRSFQHLLQIWPFVAVGLFGAWMLFRNRVDRPLFGLWLIWLAMILLQTWTSGVAWMLNHIGPGSLVAGIWFVSALAVAWHQFDSASLLEPALVTGIVLLVLAGMGVVRIPLPMLPADAGRYVTAIEKEFDGFARNRVLLDAGSWVYLPEGIVMKDRATSIGERGWSRTGDFSGVLQRIRSKHYDKLVVRNYDDGDFWYDHEIWQRPSGIRAAIADNYDITGSIPGVVGMDGKVPSYLFSRVTILQPKGRGSAGKTVDVSRSGQRNVTATGEGGQ